MTNEKVELKDVLNFFEYEKVRAEMRERVIELKRVRRVTVGRYLSFVFENRDTVLFQIQEMCRVERITDDARVQDELDVYNALLPSPGDSGVMSRCAVSAPRTISASFRSPGSSSLYLSTNASNEHWSP